MTATVGPSTSDPFDPTIGDTPTISFGERRAGIPVCTDVYALVVELLPVALDGD